MQNTRRRRPLIANALLKEPRPRVSPSNPLTDAPIAAQEQDSKTVYTKGLRLFSTRPGRTPNRMRSGQLGAGDVARIDAAHRRRRRRGSRHGASAAARAPQRIITTNDAFRCAVIPS